MEKIKQSLESLNLIYYEYDTTSNILIVDKNYSQEDTHGEMIKITYTLTKNEIEFFIDEKKDIVISREDTLLTRLKRRWNNFLFRVKNSNKNIYILTDKKIKMAKNLPMIDVHYLDSEIDLSQYEGLIFTSKNAIKALDNIDSSWKKIPAYVIAPQTAKIVKYLGGKLKFVGKEHHGDQFAWEILEELRGKKVLYVGGVKIVSNLVDILNKNGVECDYKVVYETICKEFPKKIKIPKNSVIIFSSPSTIECFLKNVTWDESYKAVSIGKTTAKFFPEHIKPIISDNTSLEACVLKALEVK